MCSTFRTLQLHHCAAAVLLVVIYRSSAALLWRVISLLFLSSLFTNYCIILKL